MRYAEPGAADVWEETLLRMRACFNFNEPQRDEEQPARSQVESRSRASDAFVMRRTLASPEKSANSEAMA
ncbi:MAG TPA: hypothetical protein VMU56_09940 [Beijerinckiaceae bacterium]|nr:hypothetical protein [Beijerinckiaceae bacterium]